MMLHNATYQSTIDPDYRFPIQYRNKQLHNLGWCV